ncbi:MAG TPA: DUF5808 domain-containing protein [Thermomicrobiales bacterium]|nr:DUF5808 domain-containing protein [Thermomicrobiales bacterium]
MGEHKTDDHKSGTFLGLPYDWRRLTWARVKARVWNPRDRRVFTPKAFGWGFTINFYELFRRLGLTPRH